MLVIILPDRSRRRDCSERGRLVRMTYRLIVELPAVSRCAQLQTGRQGSRYRFLSRCVDLLHRPQTRPQGPLHPRGEGREMFAGKMDSAFGSGDPDEVFRVGE